MQVIASQVNLPIGYENSTCILKVIRYFTNAVPYANALIDSYLSKEKQAAKIKTICPESINL